jgi:hypothetical protein
LLYLLSLTATNFTIMTKNELKKLIKEVLSEAKSQIDANAIVGSEIAAWKTAAEAIAKKLTADLVGKPMTGELVKGDPTSYTAKRKSIPTTIKSIDVELAYRTGGTTTKCYLSIYAKGEQGQAGELIFGEYI